MVKVALQVDQPRALIFSILTDFARYPDWIPSCERRTIPSSSGKVCTSEIVLNTMKKIRLSLRFDAEPDQLLKFDLVVSPDVKSYTGIYRLMNAAEGGTVVVTELPRGRHPRFRKRRLRTARPGVPAIFFASSGPGPEIDCLWMAGPSI